MYNDMYLYNIHHIFLKKRLYVLKAFIIKPKIPKLNKIYSFKTCDFKKYIKYC